MRARTYISLLFLLGLTACAPSHAGKTVGKGVLQAEGSLGGPLMTNLGPTIPIPNLPVGLRYGLDERVDLNGHVNLLPIFMGGFVAADLGLTWGVIESRGDGLNLAAGTGAAVMTDFKDGARVSPLVDTALGYTAGRLTPFIGVDVAADLWAGALIANPYAGLELELGKWSLSAAAVWFYVGHDTYSSPVRYVSVNDNGAIGVLLGVKYRWAPKDERGGGE